MGFRVGAYAKVWKIEAGKGKSYKAQISISKKNKDTDTYEQEFGGFVMMIGAACTKAASLKEGDRIKLGDVDVTNVYDKEKKVTYTNFKVWDFEIENNKPKPSVEENVTEGDTDDLPF